MKPAVVPHLCGMKPTEYGWNQLHAKRLSAYVHTIFGYTPILKLSNGSHQKLNLQSFKNLYFGSETNMYSQQYIKPNIWIWRTPNIDILLSCTFTRENNLVRCACVLLLLLFLLLLFGGGGGGGGGGWGGWGEQGWVGWGWGWDVGGQDVPLKRYQL